MVSLLYEFEYAPENKKIKIKNMKLLQLQKKNKINQNRKIKKRI